MDTFDEEEMNLEQFELLRKYQSVDMELDRYEKEMRASGNRKELLKYRDFLLEQQSVLKKITSDVEDMGDRAEALADEVERLNSAVSEASYAFDNSTPENEKEAEEQIVSLQKLLNTITRYEAEIAKLRKDADAKDRLQHEVRVRSAKARAEFDRIKVLYDEEFKTASVKLEKLKKRVEEAENGIDPALLEKYKTIKRHSSPPITELYGGRCGGCNTQLPAVDMDKLRRGAAYVECENCGRIILAAKDES